MADLLIDHAEAKNRANDRQGFDRSAHSVAIGNQRSDCEIPAQSVQKNSKPLDERRRTGELEKEGNDRGRLTRGSRTSRCSSLRRGICRAEEE